MCPETSSDGITSAVLVPQGSHFQPTGGAYSGHIQRGSCFCQPFTALMEIQHGVWLTSIWPLRLIVVWVAERASSRCGILSLAHLEAQFYNCREATTVLGPNWLRGITARMSTPSLTPACSSILLFGKSLLSDHLQPREPLLVRARGVPLEHCRVDRWYALRLSLLCGQKLYYYSTKILAEDILYVTLVSTERSLSVAVR